MARLSTPKRPRIPQTFHQVTVAWKHLTHPNIVPLLGVTIDPLQLISDQMPGGNLAGYILSHPNTNRASLVSELPASLYESLTPRPAVWCCRRSQPPAFVQYNSRRPQRSVWSFPVRFNTLIDA